MYIYMRSPWLKICPCLLSALFLSRNNLATNYITLTEKEGLIMPLCVFTYQHEVALNTYVH